MVNSKKMKSHNIYYDFIYEKRTLKKNWFE